jgi:hypothetical protein
MKNAPSMAKARSRNAMCVTLRGASSASGFVTSSTGGFIDTAWAKPGQIRRASTTTAAIAR